MPYLLIFPTPKKAVPVAQLDRVPDYESGGRRFESFRVRQTFLREIRAMCRKFHFIILSLSLWLSVFWSLPLFSMSPKEKKFLVIYKHDGSLQCQKIDTNTLSLKKMKETLSKKQISVHSGCRGTRGFVMTLCNSPTNSYNFYKIPSSQKKSALALGFMILEKKEKPSCKLSENF